MRKSPHEPKRSEILAIIDNDPSVNIAKLAAQYEIEPKTIYNWTFRQRHKKEKTHSSSLFQIGEWVTIVECPHQTHNGWSGKLVSRQGAFYRVKIASGICRTKLITKVGNETAGYLTSSSVQLNQARDELATSITHHPMVKLSTEGGLGAVVDGHTITLTDGTKILMTLPTTLLAKQLFRLLGEAINHQEA